MAKDQNIDRNMDRYKTTWDEVNDTRGKTEIIDPNKGPKRKRGKHR